MEESIKTNREIQREMYEKVNDIHFALMGNPQAKINGIAEKVSDHETYIDSDKKLKWMGAGAWSVLNLGFFVWLRNKLGL